MSPRVWSFVVSLFIDLFLSFECLYLLSILFISSMLLIILHVVEIHCAPAEWGVLAPGDTQPSHMCGVCVVSIFKHVPEWMLYAADTVKWRVWLKQHLYSRKTLVSLWRGRTRRWGVVQVYHELQELEQEEKGRKVVQEIRKGESIRGETLRWPWTWRWGEGLKHLEPQCVCGWCEAVDKRKICRLSNASKQVNALNWLLARLKTLSGRGKECDTIRERWVVCLQRRWAISGVSAIGLLESFPSLILERSLTTTSSTMTEWGIMVRRSGASGIRCLGTGNWKNNQDSCARQVLLRRNLTIKSRKSSSLKTSTTLRLFGQQGLVRGRYRQGHFNLPIPRRLFEYWTSLEWSILHAHIWHRSIFMTFLTLPCRRKFLGSLLFRNSRLVGTTGTCSNPVSHVCRHTLQQSIWETESTVQRRRSVPARPAWLSQEPWRQAQEPWPETWKRKPRGPQWRWRRKHEIDTRATFGVSWWSVREWRRVLHQWTIGNSATRYCRTRRRWHTDQWRRRSPVLDRVSLKLCLMSHKRTGRDRSTSDKTTNAQEINSGFSRWIRETMFSVSCPGPWLSWPEQNRQGRVRSDRKTMLTDENIIPRTPSLKF